MKPIVAIVGRPNVGKSTLFNRLIQRRTAIVESEPGITRDRLYADVEWQGRLFTLVDTGGLVFDDKDEMTTHIRRQAEAAVKEAQVIIFLVDGRSGMTHTDKEVADVLRKTRKPVILAVNKIESDQLHDAVYDFYPLGFTEVMAISAAHGLNIGDFLDLVTAYFPPVKEDEKEEKDRMKVAVIGRPNVGKSSLINTLAGEERVIVSEVAGTTRDAVDLVIRHEDDELLFIDTAGMRRRSKIKPDVERYGVMRALKAIDRSDVVLLVLDASLDIALQDKRIAGYAHEAGKAMIIVMNKWDLAVKDQQTAAKFRDEIRYELSFVPYAPVLFVSAKTGLRVSKIFALIKKTTQEYFKRLSTPVINELVREAVNINPAPTDKGRSLKIYYAVQVSSGPPTFVFFVNDPRLMHFSYQRYLENQFREAFGFEGTPLKMMIRKRG